MCRGHLEMPSTSRFYTLGLCSATMHQPRVSSSLPSNRIAKRARGSLEPLRRLTHETGETLSPHIIIGTPSFSGRSRSHTIKHHAVMNMPRSSSRLIVMSDACRFPESSWTRLVRMGSRSSLQNTFNSGRKPPTASKLSFSVGPAGVYLRCSITCCVQIKFVPLRRACARGAISIT